MPTKKKTIRKTKSPQHRLAEIVKEKGSERAVAEELRAAGVKCSQQAVSAWIKKHWPPRPATQVALKTLYGIPMRWSAV